MATDHEKKLEVMLDSYKAEIRDIYERMTFYCFENKKPYSFDYWIKPVFDIITDRLQSNLNGDSLPLSSSLSNKLPIPHK